MHFPKNKRLLDFLWQAPLSIVSSLPWGVLFLQFEIQLASLKVFTGGNLVPVPMVISFLGVQAGTFPSCDCDQGCDKSLFCKAS